MLARRSLELRSGQHGLAQPLIEHETLLDCGRAEAVLAQAEEQARELLQRAEAQRDALLAQAQRQFWQQAETQLREWEHQRQQMWNLLEEQARTLVNRALDRLLDETPPPVRLDALLRQLARSQSEPISATLRCHPQTADDVQQWLDGRTGELPWRLRQDDTLAPDELWLVNELGDFHLDWNAVRAALLLPDEHGQP